MGSLHEENISLWVGTTPETTYPALAQDIDVDVAVIGAGIAGLSVAAMLKREGARVAVLEAGRVASGVTGYTTAKVTSLHGATYADLLKDAGEEHARLYGEANEAAIAEVAAMVERLGIDCDFRHGDAYTYTIDSKHLEKIHAEVDAATFLGLPASFTTTTDLPYAIEGAVKFTEQAMFHPRKYCIGLAASIVGDGSHVYEMTKATDVTCEDRCQVTTEQGTVRADHVVMATHLPFLQKGAFYTRAHPERSYAMAVELNGSTPKGMYLSIDTPSRSVRPHLEGDTAYVILGGEGHKVGQDPDTRERYEALETWARQEFDVRSIAYRWSAQDYMPVDDVPYIGRITSNEERILVATGFKKWGMTTGTVAGMILTDMINGRESPYSAVFDSTRKDFARSAKQFVTENLNVAKHLIGDRIKTMKPESPADLGNGEAGIVEEDGEKLAAYRDDKGELIALSPHCTHMGCLVAFNTAEKSWDCPCHGSRFAVDGVVLQGPALKDLERKTVTDLPVSSTER